jgi:hypothetical protein
MGKMFREPSEAFLLAQPSECQGNQSQGGRAVNVLPRKKLREAAHLAVRFAQHHVRIDYFQNMCSELIHILQGYDLKSH